MVIENAITQRFLAESRGSARFTSVKFSDYEEDMIYGSHRNLNRPFFLTAAEHAQICDDLAAIFTLLCDLPRRLFDGDVQALADAVSLPALQTEAVMRTGLDNPVMIGRSDLYRTETGFRMLEYNLTSALGGWQGTLLNRVMLHDESLAEFVADEGLTYSDCLRGLIRTMTSQCLLDDAPQRPFVALTDWPTMFPMEEARLRTMAGHMSKMGVDVEICHMGNFEYRDGYVFLGGRKVDVIFRMYILDHVLQGPYPENLLRPMLRAVERGKVGICSPFDTELYGNKACFALLHDEQFRGCFTPAERSLIDRFIPRTYQLHQDRVRFAIENQHELILKPNGEYDGHGITAGWTVTPEDWAGLVTSKVGGPFILQERVKPAPERYVDPDAPDEYRETILNWGMFASISMADAGAYVKGTDELDTGVVSVERGARFGCVFHEQPR